MTSPAAVARLVKRLAAPQPRIGFATAVDLGQQLVTVAFEDGSTTSSLSWASSSYTSPTVGDRVLVIPTSTGWVVSSKVTPRPVLVPDQQVVIEPSHNYGGQREIPTDGSTPGAWSWYDAVASPYQWQRTFITQGLTSPQAGDGTTRPPYNYEQATALTYPLAAAVPSGATISQVQIILRCGSTFVGGDGAAVPVAPILYGHTYTALPSGAPSWAPGFGPVRFPTFVIGDVQVITLPASWVTAILAGTLAGVGFYTPTPPADSFFAYDEADTINGVPQLITNTQSGFAAITFSGGTT